MKDYYEEIVRELYFNLRPKFIRILTAKYPSIRLDEAEDLYQDAFIAVKENMEKGKVRDNLAKVLFDQTKRRPAILPVVMEAK